MFDCQNHLINQQRGRTNRVITKIVRSQEFERTLEANWMELGWVIFEKSIGEEKNDRGIKSDLVEA